MIQKHMLHQNPNHQPIQSTSNLSPQVQLSKTNSMQQQDKKVNKLERKSEIKGMDNDKRGRNTQNLTKTINTSASINKQAKDVKQNNQDDFEIQSNSDNNYEGGDFDDADDFDQGDDDQNQENDHQNNQGDHDTFDAVAGAIGGASDFIGGGGGAFGDALGMEGNTGMTDLEQEMMGIENEPGTEETVFKIKVFINMDEDDDGDKGINLHSLFKLDAKEMPYNVDIKLEDHHNCNELVVDSIEQFNNRLADAEIDAPWRLDDEPSKFSDNYCVYSAKKKGLAKDDYPSFSMTTNVKKANHERFSISCFSSAFIDLATFNAKTKAQSNADPNQQPNNADGVIGESVGFSHVTGSMKQSQSLSEQQTDQINTIQKVSGSISLEKPGARRSEAELNKINATTKGCCSGCQIF